jgi:hypothetical protein
VRYLTLTLLFAFGKICFGEELPIVKFPNKKEIEKAKIKELIKELDANSKEELLKADQQKKELKENLKEEIKPLPSTASNPSSPKLYNTATTNKPIYTTKSIYYKKSPVRSKAYCPT